MDEQNISFTGEECRYSLVLQKDADDNQQMTV